MFRVMVVFRNTVVGGSFVSLDTSTSESVPRPAGRHGRTHSHKPSARTHTRAHFRSTFYHFYSDRASNLSPPGVTLAVHIYDSPTETTVT